MNNRTDLGIEANNLIIGGSSSGGHTVFAKPLLRSACLLIEVLDCCALAPYQERSSTRQGGNHANTFRVPH